MDTAVLRRKVTEFDSKKLGKTLLVILIIQALVFIYLYTKGHNPVNTVSNFVGKAEPPRILFSIYGSDTAPMQKPMAVTVVDDRIYVTDTGNQRVQVFDYNGNPLSQFGKSGSGKGEFGFPYGIAADSKGNIYVADLKNGNISVFSKDGVFKNYFSNSTEIYRPAGLFIDGDNLYVTDLGLHKVKVFSLDGKKIREFGKLGDKNGEFKSPNVVTVAGGKIYVADTGNDRVQVFDKLGNYAFQMRGDNSNDERVGFVNPRGIGIDGRGTIYVVNNLTSEVFAFDSQGKRLFAFGKQGTAPDQFMLPNGLAVDSQGRIYVTDTVNKRVSVFQN